MNRLYYGDNLDVLGAHIKDESVDLVYLDPPFNSNRDYNVIFARSDRAGADQAQIQAFSDTWRWTPTTSQQYADLITGGLPNEVATVLTAMHTMLGENDAMAYLVNMAPRLVELRRVLKPSGSIYLHCDPTASHYLKLLMDAIFGVQQFRNEVIWWYRKWSKSKKHFLRNHDVILFYAKGPDQKFNILRVPLSPSTLKRFGGKVQDFADEARTRKITLDEESEGGFRPDVWNINLLPAQAAERLGYPTQKPLALLRLIIEASSDPGDVVLDPFCGCGTTLSAAQELGRSWIGIDVTYIAVDLIEKRLQHTFGESIHDTYTVYGIPRDKAGALALFSHSPFDFERWAVSLLHGQPNQKQVGDKGVDGVARFPLDARGNFGRILISVKGGRQVNPSMVRDLGGTVTTQGAEMGILVTNSPPTRGMLDEANHAGTYQHPHYERPFPRIQIVAIDDLLLNKMPTMPPTVTPYIKASRSANTGDQVSLFDAE